MSQQATLQTPRLDLRPLSERDIPALFVIQGNADAMRFTYAAPTLEECTRRLRKHEAMRAIHGFAPWVVVDRSSSLPIGWGGLNIDPFDPGWGVEVSYFFHPDYWGVVSRRSSCLRHFVMRSMNWPCHRSTPLPCLAMPPPYEFWRNAVLNSYITNRASSVTAGERIP